MPASGPTATLPVSLAELQERRRASADIVRMTPVFSSRSLSARCGGEIHLKAENLQRTGSFKLRGAMSKLGTLDPACTEVVAGSAGNHAQALAYAARARGIALHGLRAGRRVGRQDRRDRGIRGTSARGR